MLLIEFELSTPSRKVQPKVLHELKEFQSFIKTIWQHFDKKSNITPEDFRKLRKVIKQYQHKPYAKPVINFVKDYTNRLLTSLRQKRRVKYDSTIFSSINQMEKLFLAKKYDTILQNAPAFIESVNSLKNANTQVLSHASNPLRIQFSPFGKNMLLDKFGQEEFEKFLKIDIEKNQYSTIPWKDAFLNDYVYMIYFIMNLQSSKVIQDFEAYTYTNLLYYGDPDFSHLKRLVDEYLHANRKKLLVEILERMKKFPELVRLNNQTRNSVSKVYRGIAGDFEPEEGLVATTTSKYVAKEFAYGRGNVRTDGEVVTYEVEPKDIVLDTRIFGGAYGESEIIINATTASLIID